MSSLRQHLKPLWKPDSQKIKKTQLYEFQQLIKKKYSLKSDSYAELHTWSVTNPALFWEEVWKFCGIISSKPYKKVMGTPHMPGTKWFHGAQLNFAENLLRFSDEKAALIYHQEDGETLSLSYRALNNAVAKFQPALKHEGLKTGDRVASLLSNSIETVVGMLASTSLGGVWSSCSPEFGEQGILDRFSQIKPKILFAPHGYRYNGKFYNILDKLKKIQDSIPSITCTIICAPKSIDISHLKNTYYYSDLFLELEGDKNPEFVQLPFDHPLYIMYSSGTTGVPKCIVHSAGGTLIQHLKELKLHVDLKREDVISYYTTCGWMMWNWLISSLACGGTVVLYDGSAVYPHENQLWKLTEEHKISVLGASPKYFSTCEKAGVDPIKECDLSSLRTLLSTGSPLAIENFKWIYSHIKKDVQLASICGGTDIISCFMLGCPTLPVYPGEIQCLGLGMDVKVYNDEGKSVIGEKGELVCTTPFPSMPIYFWNDPDGKKYYKAYFDMYPKTWRHGDFIELTKHGGIIVYGRSDATLKPGGVRIGTSEIYRVVESHPKILDSIVVGHNVDNDTEIILFVVLKNKEPLTDNIKKELSDMIKQQASPRHKPKHIFQVSDIPRTMSGKKVELAVTNIIHHEEVKNKSALANPETLEEFKNFF